MISWFAIGLCIVLLIYFIVLFVWSLVLYFTVAEGAAKYVCVGFAVFAAVAACYMGYKIYDIHRDDVKEEQAAQAKEEQAAREKEDKDV